ncbi:MAG TPA: lipid-binding SYLF domain-containing protein [Acetobacteraceae bacterium]|nr:lipid-binding SYLF domain-containing protein [Acetobacteraceae bacterium]
MLERRRFATSVALGCLWLAGCTQNTATGGQQSTSSQQSTVDQATHTVATMKAGGGAKVAGLLQKAKAVMIFPDLVKGGVGLGASRGQGVLLGHTATGWSDPAFYESTAVSVGLQIGLEESAVVMFVLSQKALDTLLQTSSFTMKAGGGLSLADLNTATQDQLNGADVVIWSKSSGAFGGLTVSGSDIAQHTGEDQAYYGQPVTARDIIAGKVTNPAAAALVSALGA